VRIPSLLTVGEWVGGEDVCVHVCVAIGYKCLNIVWGGYD